MNLLNTFSDDVLILILSELPQRVLSVVCCVCKTLYRISNPLLYRNIELTRPLRLYHPTTTIDLLCQSFSLWPRLLGYVRSLALSQEEPSLLSKALAKTGFSFSNLKIIKLSHTHHLWIAELKTLIVSTPNLEFLECELEVDAEPHGGPPAYPDCKQLYESIIPAKSTLKSLKLSIWFIAYVALDVDFGGSYEDGHGWGIKGKMGSLKKFEKLNVLELPIAVLFGWSADTNVKLTHVLPPNLGTLTLRHDLAFCDYHWDDEMLFAKVEEFLKDRSDMPNSTDLTLKIKSVEVEEFHNVNENRWKELETKYDCSDVLICLEEMETKDNYCEFG